MRNMSLVRHFTVLHSQDVGFNLTMRIVDKKTTSFMIASWWYPPICLLTCGDTHRTAWFAGLPSHDLPSGTLYPVIHNARHGVWLGAVMAKDSSLGLPKVTVPAVSDVNDRGDHPKDATLTSDGRLGTDDKTKAGPVTN
jgi:hypothetical protein